MTTKEILHPGQRVDDYKLVRKIGAGGFGEVWLAEHDVLQARPVAIKFPGEESAVAALTREGEIQHALDHPAIVKILGLSLRHDPPYIVMDYIDGRSLEERLLEGPLAREECRGLFDRVLDALEWAHEHKVAHQDLKPSNILLDKKGAAYVSDFGLGAVLTSQELLRSVGLTQSLAGAAGGSLPYMAPERKRGEKGTLAADIYSLGVVLYESLTGKLPEGLELPSELRPELGCALDAVLKQALHPEADRRHGSVKELREALMFALSDEALRNPPKELAHRGLVKVITRERKGEEWKEMVEYRREPVELRAPAPRSSGWRRRLAVFLGLALVLGWIDYRYRPFGPWTLLGRLGSPTLQERIEDLADEVYSGQQRLILLPTVEMATGQRSAVTRTIDCWLESCLASRPSVRIYKASAGEWAHRRDLQSEGWVVSYAEYDTTGDDLYIILLGSQDLPVGGGATSSRVEKLAWSVRSQLPKSVFFMGVEEEGFGLRNERTRSLELELVGQLFKEGDSLLYQPSLRKRLGELGFQLADLQDAEKRALLAEKLGTEYLLVGTLRDKELILKTVDLATGQAVQYESTSLDGLKGDRLTGARHLSLDPTAVASYSRLVREQMDETLGQVTVLLHRGENTLALDLVERLAGLDPTYAQHPALAYCRGLIQEAMGEVELARASYEDAYVKGQTDAELCRRLGEIYLRQAFVIYDSAHACWWPDDADLLSEAAELAKQAKDLASLPEALKEQADRLLARCQ